MQDCGSWSAPVSPSQRHLPCHEQRDSPPGITDNDPNDNGAVVVTVAAAAASAAIAAAAAANAPSTVGFKSFSASTSRTNKPNSDSSNSSSTNSGNSGGSSSSSSTHSGISRGYYVKTSFSLIGAKVALALGTVAFALVGFAGMGMLRRPSYM